MHTGTTSHPTSGQCRFSGYHCPEWNKCASQWKNENWTRLDSIVGICKRTPSRRAKQQWQAYSVLSAQGAGRCALAPSRHRIAFCKHLLHCADAHSWTQLFVATGFVQWTLFIVVMLCLSDWTALSQRHGNYWGCSRNHLGILMHRSRL